MFVVFSNLSGISYESARIVSQVVSGIGFLGGGVIIRDGLNVRGLDTAATLWCTAAIGVLTSQGLIIHAVIRTAIILLVNIALRNIVRKLQLQKPFIWEETDLNEKRENC